MKVVNSLKTLKSRDRNCRVVRRKGRVYVINKKNPRFKARQGQFIQIILGIDNYKNREHHACGFVFVGKLQIFEESGCIIFIALL